MKAKMDLQESTRPSGLHEVESFHETPRCLLETEAMWSLQASSLLKLFLRELPDPLVPAELYDRALACDSEEEARATFEELPTVGRPRVGYAHVCSLLTSNVGHSTTATWAMR